jgi:hypothetical protein
MDIFAVKNFSLLHEAMKFSFSPTTNQFLIIFLASIDAGYLPEINIT